MRNNNPALPEMKYRSRQEIIFAFILLSVGILIGTLIGSFRFQTVSHLPQNVEDSSIEKTHLVSNDVRNLLAEKGEIENEFYSTMRSCLGPGCFDSRPLESNMDRIGILSLPGSGTAGVKNLINKALENTPTKIDIVYDTHVPAYGYGKNHGWNRIIRISRNIFPHAYAILSRENILTNTTSAISPALFELQVSMK